MHSCPECGKDWPQSEPEPSFIAAFAAMKNGAVVARRSGAVKKLFIGDYGRSFRGDGGAVVLTPADVAANDWTVIEGAA